MSRAMHGGPCASRRRSSLRLTAWRRAPASSEGWRACPSTSSGNQGRASLWPHACCVLRAARSGAAHSSVLNAPISSNRRLGRAHRTLDELRAVKRAHSGTINDVLLAAAAGGLRRFLVHHGEEPAPLKAMVPVSVRDDGAAGDLGNRISFVFIELPCDEPDPERRLALVQAAMSDRKAG